MAFEAFFEDLLEEDIADEVDSTTVHLTFRCAISHIVMPSVSKDQGETTMQALSCKYVDVSFSSAIT